jgi:DNA sulfur modification protein DndD
MIRNEYLHFMQALSGANVPEGVRKIANLVLNHFDELEPIGTYQGQRVRHMVKLAQTHWQSISSEISVVEVAVENDSIDLARLKSLTVGPFRGFARQEIFDLNSQLVLIYGPNGTGKSSFCEALEFGLIGSVAEAESKRFRDQNTYYKNAYQDRFVPPVIDGLDINGETISVASSESKFRFCFVEKNRIDNFSRIASYAPAKQSELISTLFGLEKFYDFARNFSDEIKPEYIDTIGKQAQALALKQRTLEAYKLTKKTNEELLAELTAKELTLSSQFNEGSTFSAMIAALGSLESPGEIQALNTELLQGVRTITGLSVQTLETASLMIATINKNLTVKIKELAEVSQSLSFKKLYEAVKDLADVDQNNCPACKTPITQSVNNPYALAEEELAKLEHLSAMQDARDILEVDLTESFRSVHRILVSAIQCLSNRKQTTPLSEFVRDNESKVDSDWWDSLHAFDEPQQSAWKLLVQVVSSIEEEDAKISAENEAFAPKKERLSQLCEFERQALVLQTQRATYEDAIKNADTAIETFTETNRQLIDSAETEKTVVAENIQISSSYSQFVIHLDRYIDELPLQYVSDLGATTVALYNSFNRNDPPKDLLSDIRLPVAAEQRIEIAFTSEPTVYRDALHILSEGHIRCIGLAILLAKNLKENCPILVFDDPVNAIDDEHRDGIRQTLFKDGYFTEKQIILACHGSEFFQNIHQLIGKETSRQSASYIFSTQLNLENHIQCNSLNQPINYVLAADSFHKAGNFRDALMSSRRAMEDINTKVWLHFIKSGGGSISVSKKHPDAPIDTRTLTEKLKSEIKRANFDIPHKDVIVNSLSAILGESGNIPPWKYLNKGTHEESNIEEFDNAIVALIIRSLSEIDAVLA